MRKPRLEFHNFDIDVHWESQYLNKVSTSTFKHKKFFIHFHKQHLNTVSPSEIGAKKITNIEDHCEFWISLYVDVKILFSASCQGRRPRRGCPAILTSSDVCRHKNYGDWSSDCRAAVLSLCSSHMWSSYHQALPLAHAHFLLLLYLDQAKNCSV